MKLIKFVFTVLKHFCGMSTSFLAQGLSLVSILLLKFVNFGFEELFCCQTSVRCIFLFISFQGLNFLEMKYHMLLSYLINLTYVVLRKCSGRKIEGDPTIGMQFNDS